MRGKVIDEYDLLEYRQFTIRKMVLYHWRSFMIYIIVKRTLDIILSFLAIIILLPLFLIIVTAIKIDSKGPVLFRQIRVGKNKTLFYIYKFRTIKADMPQESRNHMISSSDANITRVGSFLKKTNLEWLPLFWNIFIGHMSIVGPCPALWNQYDLIDERDKYQANNMKPGLTGLAQIKRWGELPNEVKAGFDGEYVKKMNFWMDLQCFFEMIIDYERLLINVYQN